MPELAMRYLLRTVLSRPTLAAHVHNLNITWVSSQGYELDPDSGPTAAQLNGLFAAASARVGQPSSDWSQDAQLVLLLHHLPNVRKLELNTPSTNFQYAHAHFEAAIRTPTPLLALGLRSLRAFHTAPNVATPWLVALLRLPSLRTIEIGINDYDDTPVPSEIKGTSGVTDLTLSCMGISTAVLASLLQIPAALTRFSYDEIYDEPYPVTEADAAAFSAALQPLRPTLQHLVIHGLIRALGSGISDLNRIGSLRAWPNLRTLCCPMETLLGWPMTAQLVHVVPAVIRDLELKWEITETQWPVDCVAQLVQLLQMKEACELRALARLTVKTPESVLVDGVWISADCERVEKALGREGVAAGVEVCVA